MATLNSPGSQVTIINESFYTEASKGTTPLIVIATRANKLTPNGKSIAPGTTAKTAGKLYHITSQRELTQTFGDPYFYSVQGTQQHGHELNEYGLLAAYHFLGQSSRAYVIRADIDTYQLQPSSKSPRAAPLDQTVWFDLNDTATGLFVSKNAGEENPFVKQAISFIIDYKYMNESTGFPVDSYGANGDFAMMVLEGNNRIFEKIKDKWYHVGSTSWKAQKNLILSSSAVVGVPFGSILRITDNLNNSVSVTFEAIPGETQYSASAAVTKLNAAIDSVTELKGKIAFGLNASSLITLSYIKDSITLTNESGTPLTSMKLTAGTYYGAKLTYSPHTNMPTGAAGSIGSVWIKTTKSGGGSSYAVKVYNEATGQWDVSTYGTPLFANMSAATAGFSYLQTGQVFIHYNAEGTDSTPLASHVLKRWNGTTWEELTYEVSYDSPSSEPDAGTLWYNNTLRTDIMVNTGSQWVGYRKAYPNADANGVIMSSKKPTTQVAGTPLVDKDLWLDTSDLENYPKLYRYNGAMKRWFLIDNTDQTTPYSAIVFADAREDSGPDYVGAGANYTRYSTMRQDLCLSNYVDPDCVDPLTYPVGTLLFNTRYSTYNVKEWRPDWFKEGEGNFDKNVNFSEIEGYSVGTDAVLFPALTDTTLGRWVTVSGNNLDGSPKMGRHAQRGMIVKALQSTVASNQNLRSEIVEFNLMAAPGYTELIDELLLLNYEQKLVSFIVGDTPIRLTPDATSVQEWATNASNAASNGEKGLTTLNEHVGIYYPWGLATNVDGSEVMVPPSSIALVTMAMSDSISYPWYAPAGFTNGLVLNASSVGYLDSEGEYEPLILNEAQRDTLYLNKINPIAYIPKRGLAIYGQKTLSPLASSLDRINVVRLTNYLRYELDRISEPFLFQVNDDHTRESMKTRIERFMAGLRGQNAIDDYAVICDRSNNTVERVNRNELWCDIICSPLKSVEFIYMPVRIRQVGDTMEL